MSTSLSKSPQLVSFYLYASEHAIVSIKFISHQKRPEHKIRPWTTSVARSATDTIQLNSTHKVIVRDSSTYGTTFVARWDAEASGRAADDRIGGRCDRNAMYRLLDPAEDGFLLSAGERDSGFSTSSFHLLSCSRLSATNFSVSAPCVGRSRVISCAPTACPSRKCGHHGASPQRPVLGRYQIGRC